MRRLDHENRTEGESRIDVYVSMHIACMHIDPTTALTAVLGKYIQAQKDKPFEIFTTVVEGRRGCVGVFSHPVQLR